MMCSNLVLILLTFFILCNKVQQQIFICQPSNRILSCLRIAHALHYTLALELTMDTSLSFLFGISSADTCFIFSNRFKELLFLIV
jgi:hypothetical protein